MPEPAFITRRSQNLLREDDVRLALRADRILLGALGVEWLAASVLAAWPWLLQHMASASQRPAVSGGTTTFYIGCGGATMLLLVSLFLILRRPSEQFNRYVLAGAQLGFTALFAWLAAGRWSATPHFFLSVVLLTFYRDWRVLALAFIGAALEIFVLTRYLPIPPTGAAMPVVVAAANKTSTAVAIASTTIWLWLRPLIWLGLTTGFLATQCALARREQWAASLRQAQGEYDATGPTTATVPKQKLAPPNPALAAEARELQNRLAQAARAEAELRADLNRAEAALRTRTQELQNVSQDLERQSAIARQAPAIDQAEVDKWKFLPEFLPQIVWTSNPEGRLDYFNACWKELTGLGTEKSCGEGWKNAVHPEDLPTLLDRWRTALATGSSFCSEYRLRGTDGRYRFQVWRAVPVKNQSGAIVQWAGTSNDFEAAKPTNPELELHEERFRTIVDASAQIIWLGNAKGRVVTDLPSWRAATGQTTEQVLGYGWLDALHPSDRPAVERTWQEKVSAGAPFEMISRAQTPDGSWRHYQMRVAPIFHADGTLREWVGAATDITERQLAEEALQQAHDHLEQRVAERTAQLSESNEALQQQVSERRHIEAELAEARDAAVRSARMKSQFLANMSHEIRTPMNGVIGMTSLLLETPLNTEQRDCVETIRQSGDALLTIINDILDFSKIEAGRLAFDEADFELRSTVRSAVEVLVENAQVKMIDLNFLVQENVPATLRGDAGRLRQVLLNLLSNAVKFTPAGGRVLLKVVCRKETASEATLAFEISDTGIGMDENVQRTLFQPFTQADGSMTRRYGGTGLGLAICKQLVELMRGEISVESQLGQGSTFRFTVQLAKGNASASINPRSEAPRSEPPIITNVARLRSIAPPSRPAAPIQPPQPVITHRLPAQRPFTTKLGADAAQNISPLPASKSADPELRVLVVEDNTVSQKVLARLLHNLGCAADIVGNGREALEACSRADYDVIFMDCQMPEMDGMTATRHLRAKHAGDSAENSHRPVVIALTANALAGDRERCLAAGMDDYLTKPIKSEKLAAALKQWAPRNSVALQSAA